MFIGHFGLAFGAKAVAPRASLGTLFVAAQLADLLWPTLVLAGLERVAIAPAATAVTPLDFQQYPYSHSLLMLVAWGILLGMAYRWKNGSTAAVPVVLGLLVMSHWLLDVISHRPDVPLAPGGTLRLGFGLWNSVGATLTVEFTLLAAGVALYARSTNSTNRTGTVALGLLVAFLSIIELANVFGPPPPSTTAVVWSAEALWLLVAWGYWADHHRRLRDPPAHGV